MKMGIYYKLTRPDGTDWRTGKVHYDPGTVVEVADCDGPGHICGRGIHLAYDARQGCHHGRDWGGAGHQPWGFREVEVDEADIIARDVSKMRVRRCRVIRELSFEDVFGFAVGQRVADLRSEIASWKVIPWLAPARRASDDEIGALVEKWRHALATWHASLRHKWLPELPARVRVVRGADAAAADADAATAAAASWRWSWSRWYVRPNWVLWRHWRWQFLGLSQPSPWSPLVELYRLGCRPIGYVRAPDGGYEFVVYAPAPMCPADDCTRRMVEEASVLTCDCGVSMAADEGS